MKFERKTAKLTFIILSIIIVMFSLMGNIITSNKGSVSLLFFESFYVYIVAIIFSLYKTFKNKSSNISIIIALLTYLWTFYLVYQMLENITDIKLSIDPNFYVYLSSSLFLFISLFFNPIKITDNKQETTNQANKLDVVSNNNLSENNFIFTNSIIGLKEIPYNTTVLLVNNIPNNSIELIYNINNINQTKSFPINIVKSITYANKVRTSNVSKKIDENKTKSMLLSAVVFGGNPLVQMMGNSGFNSLFNSLSNNYEKVIELLINNESSKLVFSSQTNPESFIQNISI